MLSEHQTPRLLAEPLSGVPEVISTPAAFQEMCLRFSQASGSLAADAERASGFRYGHEDWLVQFKREESGIALVDPIALGDSGISWQAFNDAVGQATWIIHDALQDLPGFSDLGMQPKALFDTELAARMLGLHHFGLAAVTEHYLGLVLAKEHSAADWSYRPLPRDWRNYAALDVELLIDLERRMRADLKAQGKDSWAEEEFTWLLDRGTAARPPRLEPWLRVSHISDLHRDRRGLAVVKELWTLRDALAREHDIAPSLLLSDSAIIEAAKVKPRNLKAFRSIRSLNQRVRVRTGGEQDKMFERYAPIQRQVKATVWKDAIQRALDLAEDELPVMPARKGGAAHGDENNAPRSMRLWQQRHPERFERLGNVRRVVNIISQDTRTPADVIIKPQYLRNLCWLDDVEGLDVAEFLHEQGARNWQIELLAESVSRAIM
ncbi:MAG: HRDC domain-containing protein [Bifidobacterium psychraerophilum]|uniref:HRDC domain-containing protein n=1 Tax=Bifidobacterium psychraerophilum TaxID=218140 RepID=UPI0039EC75D8